MDSDKNRIICSEYVFTSVLRIIKFYICYSNIMV